jgi:hypothetical protein
MRTLILAAALGLSFMVSMAGSPGQAQPKQCAQVAPKSFPCGPGEARACKQSVQCMEGSKKTSKCVEWSCVVRKQ